MTGLRLAAFFALGLSSVAFAGEATYNGLRPPSPWPPRVTISAEPMAVPYRADPPAVIPIEVGRQLFVDDFLIDKTDLARTFHQAAYHPVTPVLRPDKPWEMTAPNPSAMVFSDGVWYDAKDKQFKMWYKSGYAKGGTAFATSRDGIHWEKPVLDVQPGTNMVLVGSRDSETTWLDHDEKDPGKRFKLFRWRRAEPGKKPFGLGLYTSPDGIHWTEAGSSGPCGDRTTVFYNPFRKVWVYGIRSSRDRRRARDYWENADFLAGAKWKAGEPVPWVSADRLDPIRDDLKTPCQLYNLDAVGYESVLLGLFSIWRGQPADRPKPNEVCVGFSRDGFHWDRPDRRAFIPVSERHGDWNWGNVQSAGGCCLVIGDQLYFYVSARAGVKGTRLSGECTTGLAVLRRDGFASMDVGAGGGVLTTRRVRFAGTQLFVNLAAPEGELRTEVLDDRGAPIEPFTRDNCLAVRGDKTLLGVTWRGADDLAALAGKPVRFRFHLKNGKLYSFWVSPDKSGASHGYVAAGGPGFSGSTDTAGAAAYEAAAR